MNYRQLLNETKIGSSLTTQFPNLYPSIMFQLVRFSPTYDPEYEECKMTIHIEPSKMQIVTSVASQFDGIECSQNAVGSSVGLQFTYKCPGIMKAQGMMYPHLKQLFLGNVPKTLKFHDGMLDIIVSSKSTFELCNIFKLCKTFETTHNLKNFQPYSKEDMMNMQSDVKAELATHVQKVQIPGQSSVVVEGKYNDVREFIAKLNTYDIGATVDESNIDVVNLSKIYEDQSIAKIFGIANAMISQSNAESVLSEFRNKRISKMLNLVIKNNQDYKADQIKQRKAQQNGQPFISSGVKYIDLDSIKTLVDLFNVAGKISAMATGLPDPDSISNATARRRLKLFTDAKFYGAALAYNAEWICAACTTVASASLWSRNKPRVYADGQNRIIPYSNLRDDELEQVTLPTNLKAMYKKIRDAKESNGVENYTDSNGNAVQLKWSTVKDNLGFDDNSRECYWCTAGAFQPWQAWEKHTTPVSNWYTYNCTPKSRPGSIENRRPNWVFMRISDGALFQYTNGWYSSSHSYSKKLLNENDGSQGYGGAEAMATGFIQKYPNFADLVKSLDKIGDDDGNASNSNNETIPTNFKLEYADDGSIIVASKSLVDACLLFATQENIDSFTIKMRDASGLFENEDLTNISRINFDGVKNAADAFKNAFLPRKFVVVGTSQIVDASGMFQNSKGLQSLEGLNLKRCKSARQCFCGMIGYHNEPVTIQNQLSLPQCEDISYMFFASPIVKIDLADTNNVRLAESMCQYATYLEEIPNLRFEKVPTYNQLISQHGSSSYGQVSDDPTIFFAGCSTLYRRFDLEDEGERLIQYYDWKHDSSQPTYRSDGFIVIKSRSDLEAYRKFLSKAPGIFIDLANATQLFKDFPLNCDTLDLDNVVNADKMFENCNILHIRNIINSDNITTAKEMFAGCKAGFLPEISLQKVIWIDGIFKNSQLMHFPKLQIGMHVKTDMSNLASIFGNALNANDDIVLRQSLSRVQSWYENSIKNQPEMAFIKTKLIQLENGNPDAGFAFVVDDDRGASILKNNILMASSDIFGLLNVKKIIIDIPDATNLFAYKDAHGTTFGSYTVSLTLPPIDLRGVENAYNMFGHRRFEHLLIIENADNVRNCTEMFIESEFVDGLKLCSFPSAKNCKSMFYYTRLPDNSPIVNLLEQQFPQAEQCANMFTYSRNVLPSTVNLTNALRNVVSGQCMFYKARVSLHAHAYECVCIEGDINCPRLENGSQMFSNVKINRIKNINLPQVKTASQMFSSLNFEHKTISSIDMPIAEDINGLFMNSDIETIGSINAPNAKNATRMFSVCHDLKNIGLFVVGTNNRNTRRTDNMFERTPLVAQCGKNGQKLLEFFDLINPQG